PQLIAAIQMLNTITFSGRHLQCLMGNIFYRAHNLPFKTGAANNTTNAQRIYVTTGAATNQSMAASKINIRVITPRARQRSGKEGSLPSQPLRTTRPL